MMNNYKYLKYFEYEHLNLRIEFALLNDKYITHKIFKNGRLILLKALNLYEHSFFRECLMCYEDFLDKKEIDYYTRGEK